MTHKAVRSTMWLIVWVAGIGIGFVLYSAAGSALKTWLEVTK